AFEAERFDDADRLARQAASARPESGAAWLLAGDVAARREQYDEALACYDKVPRKDRTEFLESQGRAAKITFYDLHRFSETERRFRRLLETDPSNTYAHGGLAYLLSICGRRWESTPHSLYLVRQGQFTAEHLCWLGVMEAVVDEAEHVRLGHEAAPDDPLPLLGLARLAVRDNQLEQAEARLRQVLDIAPELIEAHARLGFVLVDDPAANTRLREWHQQLPAGADDHPAIWTVRGLWAQQLGDQEGAVRCYGETLLRDPNRLLPNYQLSQLFRRLGQPSLADRFGRHARQCLDLGDALHRLQIEPDDVSAMRLAAERCQALGRPWEACAWSLTAFQHAPDASWAKQLVQQLHPQLHPETPQTLATANPIVEVDLSSYRLPPFVSSSPAKPSTRPEAVAGSSVRFEDVAQSVGIDFHYFNAHDPSRAVPGNYEIKGGGIAVLDYDGDGWPDVFFTQGCAWPPREDDYTHVDRLYRNLGDGHFADVTERATIRENHFGQGVAAGDYDNDGFTDLYVANIGGNRLYHNQGDGTFQEVTIDGARKDLCWTSSCLIADLNGDSLPDIYDVNYLRGDDLWVKTCRYRGGVERLCAPRMFQAEPDDVFINLGDGRFQRQSQEAGIRVEDGKGLGIVAADFDGSGMLDLFVGNDQVHNFYFRNQTQPRGGSLRFSEQGLLSGLAVDSHGRGQACMGVAAGDANDDGLLDLFVSNFHNEANCLYLQEAGDLFYDATREAGLFGASIRMMGFGTQFLDTELDGLPDLVLANGHLEDQSDLGIPYRMHPQFFHNQGEGRFVEVPDRSLGKYFESVHLGRALVRLDWNRDGREDFAVTHLHGPAALVTNRTRPAGRFLAIRLRGVQSDRDAFGTKVQVTAGGRSWRRQLTAGNGFKASNERRLVFGLGDHTHVDEVRVTWPAGSEQCWQDLPTDSEWLLVEGESPAYRQDHL
ncbi:MAG: VCBS repeat-containing protein, partial [Planctomycetes bacterium]|nr:VCBS repeat-containing protein [Planctomycetota bacterium]